MTMHTITRAAFATFALTTAAQAGESWLATNATSLAADPRIERDFRSPPAGARPWVYWVWLRVNTSREAITRDLEEMRAKGIEGLILYDCGVGGRPEAGAKMVLQGDTYAKVKTADYPNAHIDKVPGGELATWSPHWRELVRYSIREARRLDLKFCLSVGLGGTSGPIEPEFGQQKLVWSETSMTGPSDFDGELAAPDRNVPPSLGPATLPSPGGQKPMRTKQPLAARTQGAKFNGKVIAVLAVPDKSSIGADQVVNLTARMVAPDRLRWQVPAGKWKVLRFAYAPTGKRNVWGLFTDAMSAAALDRTWDVTIGRLLAEMTPDERKALLAVEDDSWEAGDSTWTSLFAAEFRKHRGYDLVPLLPALAGIEVGGPEAAQGVRRDYYRTIADLIARNHYARLRELANRNGLLAFSEAAGPNTGQLDGLQNGGNVDVAMAEFWMPSVHRPTPPSRFLLRNAANANHIYGKRVTACESFTSVGPFWEESFFDMKNAADQAFADGCNLNVIHNWSHSPSVSARPGFAYFAGTLYGRNVTWWNQAPAFNAYLGRCSLMLQQGLFVADALYFGGDAIGQVEQMKTRPALPAEGYDHDNCNLDVLLHRLSAKDGRLVLPDGMSYSILVLPDDSPLAPKALDKIAELVKMGATVVGPRPRGMAGFAVTKEQKTNFDAAVAKLWGSGRIARAPAQQGRQPLDALRAMHAPPQFECSGSSRAGQLDWIHRRANDMDVFFVANCWDPKVTVDCAFRVCGKQPELWDPVTGEIRPAAAFRQANGRTIVPLEFNPRQSVFVVFRKPIPADSSGTAASNYPRIDGFIRLTGPWRVSFDPKWGGPENITMDRLVDWTKRPEPGIKYYSGTAVYRNKFNVSEHPAAEKLLLNLGEVHEVAAVRLNGEDLGVVWTRPARIDITRAVRVGENDLEITVVNLWPNRLIGDDLLPVEKRYTQTNIHKFSKATPLYPSGLIGPVTVEMARE